MKRKKSKLIIMIILALTLMLLNGCSLAVKGEEHDSQDKLIGVFITDSYLDLLDSDSYNAVNHLPESDSATNSTGYDSSQYAVINRHNSKDFSDWEIDFEGVKGLKFFAPKWKDEDGSTCTQAHYSDGICDSRMDVLESDEGTETKLTATVYTSLKPDEKELFFYLNRVYQTDDGKIYLVSGNGNGIVTDTDYIEGDVMSASADDQTQYLENQEIMTDKLSVTVQFAIMHEPVKITLCQMDKDNKVIKQEDFLPGKLPEKLTAEKETSYILVETEKKAPDGSRTSSRDMYERTVDDDSFLQTFYALDNKIISTQHTEIIWVD